MNIWLILFAGRTWTLSFHISKQAGWNYSSGIHYILKLLLTWLLVCHGIVCHGIYLC